MSKIKIFLGLGLAGLFLCSCTTASKPNSDGDKPSHQHTYSDTWSFDSTYHWHAATCEHTSELKDKEEHVFSDWVIDVEATEQEKGLKHKECVYCQYLVSEEIEVLEHVHVPGEAIKENEQDADCTHNGSYDLVTYCTGCNQELSRETFTISALGHVFVFVEEIDPTYDEDGKMVYECSRCGELQYQKGKDHLEHIYSEEWSYDDNYHWHVDICGGHEGHSEYIEHNYVVSSLVSATYDSGEKTIYSCSECGRSYEEITSDPLQHKYSSAWSYDEYNHWHACTDRGYENLYTDYGEHNITSWTTTKEPTDTEDGTKTGRCTVCRKNIQQPIPSKNAQNVMYFSFSDTNVLGLKDEYKQLTKIFIPSVNDKGQSITYINMYAFRNNEYLEEVEIAEGINYIGLQAFYNCKNLKKVVLPSTLVTLEDYIFYGCENLTECKLPNSINSMPETTFVGCDKLPVEYENGLYIEGKDTPYAYLIDVIDKTVDKFSIYENVLYMKESVLAGMDNLRYLKIPFAQNTKKNGKICYLFPHMRMDNVVFTSGNFRNPFPDGYEPEYYLQKITDTDGGIKYDEYNGLYGVKYPSTLECVDLSGSSYNLFKDDQILKKFKYLLLNDSFTETIGNDKLARCSYKAEKYLYYESVIGGCAYSTEYSENQLENAKKWCFANGFPVVLDTAYITINSIESSLTKNEYFTVKFIIVNGDFIDYKDVKFDLYSGRITNDTIPSGTEPIASSTNISQLEDGTFVVYFNNIPIIPESNFYVRGTLLSKTIYGDYIEQYSTCFRYSRAIASATYNGYSVSKEQLTINYDINDFRKCIDPDKSYCYVERWAELNGGSSYSLSGTYTKSISSGTYSYTVKIPTSSIKINSGFRGYVEVRIVLYIKDSSGNSYNIYGTYAKITF